MRRVIFNVVLALLAAVVVAAPAAASSSRTSYVVAECGRPTNPWQVDRMTILPSDRAIIRGLHSTYDEWVFVNGSWQSGFGTNDAVANANVAWPDFQGTLWGTFDFKGEIGHFQGSWSLGASGSGRASGMSDEGTLLTVTLGVNPQDYLPLPASDCGVAEFVVLDPHA